MKRKLKWIKLRHFKTKTKAVDAVKYAMNSHLLIRDWPALDYYNDGDIPKHDQTDDISEFSKALESSQKRKPFKIDDEINNKQPHVTIHVTTCNDIPSQNLQKLYQQLRTIQALIFHAVRIPTDVIQPYYFYQQHQQCQPSLPSTPPPYPIPTFKKTTSTVTC